MNPIFQGTVKDGKIKLYNLESYKEYLLTIDGDVEVIVRKPIKRKTNPQLRYLFGVVYKMISEHTGMDIEEVDMAMKMMFALNTDTAIPTVKLKRNMSTTEVMEFTERTKRWAAEDLGLYIPEPNEVETRE